MQALMSKLACHKLSPACFIMVVICQFPLHSQPTNTSDPIGYAIHTVPENSQRLIPLQFSHPVSFKEFVTEVTASGLRVSSTVPSNVFGPVALGFLEVRIGVMSGLAIPVTTVSGNFINLERSPLGLIAVGDYISLRAERTLAGYFGAGEGISLLTGLDADEADTVSIWDARTQESRIFYLHTGAGWREKDHFSDGDMGQVPIRFPGGVIVRRRDSTPLTIVISGSVIAPYTQRYHPVWAGRNIISAPFTSEPTVAEYIRPLLDGPHTVFSGGSAPESDTLRFYLFSGGISPVIYFRSGQWREVGNNQAASNTTIDFIPCLDLQRAGGDGFIRFQGVTEAAAIGQNESTTVAKNRASTTQSVIEVTSLSLSSVGQKLRASWSAEAGKRYQVQTSEIHSNVWSNIQKPITATSDSVHFDLVPEGNQFIRVIVL